MALQAGLSVGFSAQGANGDGSRGHLSAEIDDRENGLNGGRTSFAPGDIVYFMVFTSDDVLIESVTASAGHIASHWIAPVDRTLEVTFANTQRAALPIPCDALLAVEWIGRSLGTVTLDHETAAAIAAPGVGVARLTVRVMARIYSLTTPAVMLTDDEMYPIIVHIQGGYKSQPAADGYIAIGGN